MLTPLSLNSPFNKNIMPPIIIQQSDTKKETGAESLEVIDGSDITCTEKDFLNHLSKIRLVMLPPIVAKTTSKTQTKSEESGEFLLQHAVITESEEAASEGATTEEGAETAKETTAPLDDIHDSKYQSTTGAQSMHPAKKYIKKCGRVKKYHSRPRRVNSVASSQCILPTPTAKRSARSIKTNSRHQARRNISFRLCRIQRIQRHQQDIIFRLVDRLAKNTANVIIAHHLENIDWITELNLDRFEVVLASNTVRVAPYPFITLMRVPNVVFEVSAYLQYIIQFYHTLPEYSIFVHGHRCSWHHDGEIHCLLNHLIFGGKLYRNINKDTLIQTFILDGHMQQPEYTRQMLELTTMMFPGVTFDNNPSTFRCRMCAQFFVHRDLIRRHPLSVYSNMWSALKKVKMCDKKIAIIYEHMWCWLFTGYADELEWEQNTSNI